MDDVTRAGLASTPTHALRGEPVLKEQQVQEILARVARGEPVLGIARALGVDPKTVRAWRGRGGWRPRRARPRSSILDAYAAWLRARAAEVEYNCAVLWRELRGLGYPGSVAQVHRCVRPLRVAARQARTATLRFETPPGQQAQVDCGQRRVGIGEQYVAAHLFVFTLGYSRRLYVTAFPHERRDAVLAGHEQACEHFGGVPLQIVVDNAKPVVLERTRDGTVWHPVYADFAASYGFTPYSLGALALPAPDQGEGGVEHRRREAERARGQALRLLESLERLASRVGDDGGRCPRARDDARAADRPFRRRAAHPARQPAALRSGRR